MSSVALRLARLALLLTLPLGACKTAWLGNDKPNDTRAPAGGEDEPQFQKQALHCTDVEKKQWDKDANLCLTPADACLAKKDGSVWSNQTCLSLAQQCQLTGGLWDGKTCTSQQQACQATAGQVWRGQQCVSSKQACLSQANAYRYKWVGVTATKGECRLRSYQDFCQDTEAHPDIKYTLNVLKNLTGKKDASCSQTESLLQGMIATSRSLQIYDMRDEIKIKELSPLGHFTELEELRLTNNEVSDLTPLAGLKNLRTLDLQNNRLEDLSGIEGLVKLESLYLGHNRITNLTPLQNLKALRKLHLFDNRLSELSPLAELGSLEVLYLKTNAISSIASLRGLHKLQELDLRQNPILTRDVTKTPATCPFGEGVSAKVSELCVTLNK